MAWYRAGTVSMTNGSATVTGAGTDFVSNATVGEAFLGPDGRAYEITQVVSATQIVLGMPYQGAGAGGQGYAVLPTQSFARDLARGAAELLATFAAVRDGVGQGLFPDGTVATPGVRFTNDQDTGLRRTGANAVALVAGGQDRLSIDSTGRVAIGGAGSDYGLTITSAGASGIFARVADGGSTARPAVDIFNGTVEMIAGPTGAAAFFGTYSAHPLLLLTGQTERARIDASGNLLAGITSGPCHTIARGGSQGDQVLNVTGTGQGSTSFFSGSGNAINGAGACVKVNRNTDTNRSIAAAGTINASGADYAEYMLKAAGCGIIAKGDVCGVDRDGRLTKTWADAVSFVIKSTDPSLVGGDTWDTEVGPKPEQPGAEPAEPSPPAPPAEGADDSMMAAWRDAMAAYPAQVASYQTARADWQKATDAYAKALPVWEAAHEKARQCVDRIAFCGQVPANVSGDFEVGDYIIAAASGAGIKAVAVKPDDMTLPQYMRRIGKVWAIRDGRAWIDVQHG